MNEFNFTTNCIFYKCVGKKMTVGMYITVKSVFIFDLRLFLKRSHNSKIVIFKQKKTKDKGFLS